jgi:hypothetical protein
MCWICTGPQPPNGSLLLYPPMSGLSPFLLSPFWTCSHPKTVGYVLPPPPTPVFSSTKKLEDWQAGNLHQLTTGTTPHSGTSEHHCQLLPLRDQHNPGRDYIWSCLELNREYFLFADVRLTYACPLTGQKSVLWHTFPLLSYTTDASIFPIPVTQFFETTKHQLPHYLW